jgi:hypothetical protein
MMFVNTLQYSEFFLDGVVVFFPTTAKKAIVIQPIFAVSRCTAKTSLLCATTSTHDKDYLHDKV